MNRALDGDTVAIWLEKPKFWKPLPLTAVKQTKAEAS